jgi:hypothetical protein
MLAKLAKEKWRSIVFNYFLQHRTFATAVKDPQRF